MFCHILIIGRSSVIPYIYLFLGSPCLHVFCDPVDIMWSGGIVCLSRRLCWHGQLWVLPHQSPCATGSGYTCSGGGKSVSRPLPATTRNTGETGKYEKQITYSFHPISRIQIDKSLCFEQQISKTGFESHIKDKCKEQMLLFTTMEAQYT